VSRVARVGSTVGNVLYAAGLTGPFNVGFVHREDSDDLYALEVNPRRSGSSGILEALMRLYGADWARERTVVAREHVAVARAVRDYGKVKQILEHENVLDPKAALFVFPFTVSGLPTVGHCGLLVVGDGSDTARAAMQHVTSCLSSG
jgi:hypothetical protein